MGEMVSISIGEYDFMSYKNTFGDLLTIFYEGDLHIVEGTDDGDFTIRYFSTTVGRAKKCLDILGYTVDKACDTFEKNKQAEIDLINEWGDVDSAYVTQYQDEFTFESWSVAAKLYAKVLASDDFSPECEYVELERIRSLPHSISEQIVLQSLPFEADQTFFGMESDCGGWEIFRVILDAFDDKQEVVLDYTDLHIGGWCEAVPSDEFNVFPKTVILTEGKYDAYVISESMRLLYPYLCKFYSFMDFSTFRVQGSTNFLTHYVKAFIGAQIENRIIALYDNDAAGLSEIKGLESIQLPENVKIMHLPNLDMCTDYPTVGPTADENTDINGRACSIELFLGQDILREEGKLIPVMWSGYVDKIQKYQGEIMNKGDIQKRFAGKLCDAEKNGIKNMDDWKEIDLLLNTIFGAFI